TADPPIGRWKSGSWCLLVIRVSGWSRVPDPPARMTPFTRAMLTAEREAAERGTFETVPPRARPSCLTVPASRRRMLEKAASLAVDEIVVDLEDGVAAADKDAA